MNKKKKKGFTLVELLVVIAILAVLATVSILGYSAFVKKANMANDRAVVEQMNKALLAYETIDEKARYCDEAVDQCINEGFILENLTPSTSGFHFAYDQKYNRFMLLKEDHTFEYGDNNHTDVEVEPWNIFVVVGSQEEINTATKEVDGKPRSFSIYARGEFDFEDNTNTVKVAAGFDAGKCLDIKTVNYTNGIAAQDVVIRTNGNVFTIEAPLDCVSHYGFAAEVFCTDVAVGTYNEYGIVGRLIYDDEEGKIVIADTAKVFCYMNSTSDTAADYEASENVITYVKASGEHNLDEHTVCNPVTHIVSIYQCKHDIAIEKVNVGNYIYVLCHTCGSFYQYDCAQTISDGTGLICVGTNDAKEVGEDPITIGTDKAKTITAEDLANKKVVMEINKTETMAISYMTKMEVSSNQQIFAIGADGAITYSSSNASIATVDENGNVKALAVGNVTILASTKTQIGVCSIEVTKDEPVDVTRWNSVKNETQNKRYNALSTAVSEANAGDIIKLYNNINITNISINKNLTIDLNGKIINQTGTITTNEYSNVVIRNGTINSNNKATSVDVNNTSNVDLQNVTMNFSSMNDATAPAIYVKYNGTLTIDKDTVINDECGTNFQTIYIYSGLSNNVKQTLNIYGTITSKRTIICGYGLDGMQHNSSSEINIGIGAKLTSERVAIAQLQAGTVNITGAMITADTPIVAKSGTFNISNSTLHATGESGLSDRKVMATEGSGYNYDGSVIFVDSRQYCYSGNMSFTISNSTLTSDHESIIAETGYCNYSEIKTLSLSNNTISSAKTNYVLLNDSVKPASGSFKESDPGFVAEVTYKVGETVKTRKYIKGTNNSEHDITDIARQYIVGEKYENGVITGVKLIGNEVTRLKIYWTLYHNTGDIVIDLDGKTVNFGTESLALNTNRKVTIKNGTIVGTNTSGSFNITYGDILFDGITFETSRGILIGGNADAGTKLTVNNCTFTSNNTSNAIRIMKALTNPITVNNTIFTGVTGAISSSVANTVNCDNCTDVTKDSTTFTFNHTNDKKGVLPLTIATLAQLQTAIAENDGRTYELTADITLSADLYINYNFSLDLKGHTINCGAMSIKTQYANGTGIVNPTILLKNGNIVGTSSNTGVYGLVWIMWGMTGGGLTLDSVNLSLNGGNAIRYCEEDFGLTLTNCTITNGYVSTTSGAHSITVNGVTASYNGDYTLSSKDATTLTNK